MKQLVTFLFLATVFTAYSQSPKTLIDTDPEEISGFGSVLFSFLPIDGKLSTLTGGGGAVMFDNTFFVGGYGLGMSGDREITVDNINYNTHFRHGGIWMGYIMKPVEIFHLGVESKFGWGNITHRTSSPSENRKDQVFVFYPQLTGEVNLSYWFKINAGIGYQKTIGVDNFYFSETDFDGPAFSVSLHFGWFK